MAKVYITLKDHTPDTGAYTDPNPEDVRLATIYTTQAAAVAALSANDTDPELYEATLIPIETETYSQTTTTTETRYKVS